MSELSACVAFLWACRPVSVQKKSMNTWVLQGPLGEDFIENHRKAVYHVQDELTGPDWP